MINLQAQYRTFLATNVTLAARSTLACFKAATSDPAKKHSLDLAMAVFNEMILDMNDKHIAMDAKRSLVK
jgi:hypothetical protein